MTIFYHCTKDNHGRLLQVASKPPSSVTKSGEPSTPRLCVSPSVPQCIAAGSFMMKNDAVGLYVYATDGSGETQPTQGVWDHEITGERWVPPGSNLKKLAIIQTHRIQAVYEIRDAIMSANSKTDSRSLRISTLHAACEVLTDYTSPGQAEFAKELLREHGISI